MDALQALESGAPPTLLQTLREHGAGGEITGVDVSPGGGRLLTAGGDRALRAWRWRAGAGWEQAAWAARAHRYGVTAVRWSPGGALAVSGGVDGAARVWSARELTPRRLLAAPGAPALRALCWAGADVLVCGYDDGAACVWRVRRALLVARLHAHDGALHALAAPARGALLLTACTNGVLKVFDLQEVYESGAEGSVPPTPLLWVDSAHDLGALCCDVSADGALAATGGQDARVRLWEVQGEGRGRSVAAGALLEGHGAAVTALRWAASTTRRLLASAALDRTARVWAVDDAASACLLVLHAHTRYLTCLALAPDLSYMVTGSNDKSVRVWALGGLTLDDELEPPCTPLAHFAVGDLEGIGPVDDDELLASDVETSGAADAAETEADVAGGAARRVWRSLSLHAGAVNCISVHQDRLVTACSDGVVRVFRWSSGALSLEQSLGARGYPAMAADLGAGGALLLTAGLDGAAKLWDVESGCLLRTLMVPTAAEHESGGGGARGARVSAGRPALLLLATDDGRAPLWSLADHDPQPIYMFGGHVEAALCCAWSVCGRAGASGGAAGELHVFAPPPHARTLAHLSDAHDLGVQSCDFAPSHVQVAADTLLLATAGSDALIKLWNILLDEEEGVAQVSLCTSVVGHGGGAASVRWGGGGEGSLVSAGADGWARVWRVSRGPHGVLTLRQRAALPAHAAAGTAAAAIIDSTLVALGSLSGELSVWRLPPDSPASGDQHADEDGEEECGDGGGGGEDEEGGNAPRWWGARAVAGWIRDYITRVPGARVSSELEERLLAHAREAGLSGAQLLDLPYEAILEIFGYVLGTPILVTEEDKQEEEKSECSEQEAVRARILNELRWLRRPPPDPALARVAAPHWLLCPLSHALCVEPARAADGGTYDRTALHEWFLAADGAVSAISGRRMRNSRVLPNYAARASLRDFLEKHSATDS